MFNSLRVYEELSQAMEPRAAQKLASVLGAMYEELQNTASKREFNELCQVVRELAEAQNRTEARLDQLTQRVEELAEAQNRTEARLDQLTQRVEELAEAQKRTEQRVEELAEAQKRTEQRVEELAEAQKRTEARLDQLTHRVDQLAEAQKLTESRLAELALRVDQLAVAQKRTEEALARLTLRVDHLAERLDDTNRQVGGLSATVGYTLENEAYRALPPLLERDHGLTLTEPLTRGWLQDAQGRDLEVNILGRATRGGEPLWIIGESKVQLSANDVDRFLSRRVEPLQAVCGTIFPVLVTHMITARDVADYARERGVAVYLSYQFGRSN